MAIDNATQVLVVKSPDGQTKEKAFLGYEWSTRKGAEGIHYLNTGAIKKSESDDEATDDNTLQQIKGVNGIKTPLFNPINLYDDTKINSYIRSNYLNKDFDISEEVSDFVNLYSLVDLMDFSLVEFDKIIRTTAILEYPKIETTIEQKEKLKNVAPFVKEKISLSDIDVTTYVTTDNMLQDRRGVSPYDGVPNISRITKYKAGDILVSNIRPYLKKIWLADKEGGCSNDVLVFRNVQSKIIDNDYLYAILSTDTFFDFMMTGKTGLKMPRGDKRIIPRFEIPIPDIKIQKKIAKEFKAVDKMVLEQEKLYDKLKLEIAELYKSISGESVKLGTIASIKGGDGFPKGIQGNSDNSLTPFYKVGDMNLPGNEFFMSTSNNYISQEDITRIHAKVHPKGSIIFPKVGMAIHTNKKRMLTKPACVDNNTMVVSVLDQKMVSSKFLFYYFNTLVKLSDFASDANPPSMNAGTLQEMVIVLPSIKKQRDIEKQILTKEEKIQKALSILRSAAEKKQAILDKYIN